MLGDENYCFTFPLKRGSQNLMEDAAEQQRVLQSIRNMLKRHQMPYKFLRLEENDERFAFYNSD